MVAVAQCLPLWQHHWFDSHESYAYVLRVVEFEAALRQGDPYPRWASDFYGGYGSPFFVFYAPLVFAAGASLSALLGSAVLGLKAWIVLASIASGVGAYLVVEAETHRADAASFAALVYLASPYRLANIYERGDIAEYTALAALPWAVWSYRRIARALPIDAGVGSAVIAVGAHAALLFSHAIMGLWGTLLLGALCLATTWQLLRRRTFRHIWLLWTAFALSLAVASVYTGPALLQKRYVHIALASVGYNEPSNQLLPISSLLTHDRFGILPVVLASLLLALGALGLRRDWAGAMAWSLAAATLAFLSTRYAELFWELKLPLTAFIQFPWRLHGLAALAGSLALGLAWATLFRHGSWREPSALVLGACALLVAAPICQITNPLARGSFPETTAEIRRGIYHTTGHEYLPRWVPSGPRTVPRALVSRSSHVEVTGSFSRGTLHELELVAEQAGSADLALHMFPGWHVDTVEGPAPVGLATNPAGLVSVRVPRAGKYRVQVSFGSSPVRAVFGCLSLLSALTAWPLLRFLAGARAAAPVAKRALPPPPARMAA